MQLIACYVVYNNIDYFRASLETIHSHVDKIIIVDGRYKHYPGNSNISTDGTLQVALEYQKKYGEDKIIILPPRLYLDEIEKRNAYLTSDHVKPGDWIFIIDGDEIPFGHLDLLKAMLSRERAYVVNVLEYDSDIKTCEPKMRPRLVKKLKTMKYEHNHYSIIHRGKNVFLHGDYTEKRVYPIQIIHMAKYRSEKVEQAKIDYRSHLVATEEVPVNYERLYVRDDFDASDLFKIYKKQQRKTLKKIKSEN